MTLPVPRLTATLLDPVGREPRKVIIHGDKRIRIPRNKPNAPHTCSRCDQHGHNARNKNCPGRAA